jgi:hypothetical protein
MATKIYTSPTGTGITFPVSVGNKRDWIHLDGDRSDFTTADAAVQAAIENHPKFKAGQIILVVSKPNTMEQSCAEQEIKSTGILTTETILRNTEVGGEDELANTDEISDDNDTVLVSEANPQSDPGIKTDEYDIIVEVTDINGAAAILRAEPYKVHYTKLRTPEAVREQAALNKVAFPNWME